MHTYGLKSRVYHFRSEHLNCRVIIWKGLFLFPKPWCRLLLVGQHSERYFYPFLMGGFLTLRCTWLAGNRMICGRGRQFELLIEWKGYVQWSLSIVSLSLRCAEAVMKSSWTPSQGSCDRSSGGCLSLPLLDIQHTHTPVHARTRSGTHALRDSNKQLAQKWKWSCHSYIVSQISSFKRHNVQNRFIDNRKISKFMCFSFSLLLLFILRALPWHEIRD